MSLLPIIEFEANIDRNATGLLPFLVIKGYILRSGVELPTL